MAEILMEGLQRPPIGEQRIELLVAEVIGNQTAALGAFKRLGFEKEVAFYNYVKDQAGEERNVIVMMKSLQIEPATISF